jgi:hypothetical protein
VEGEIISNISPKLYSIISHSKSKTVSKISFNSSLNGELERAREHFLISQGGGI